MCKGVAAIAVAFSTRTASRSPGRAWSSTATSKGGRYVSDTVDLVIGEWQAPRVR